jgi:integrase
MSSGPPKPPTPVLDTTSSGKQRWVAKFRVGGRRLSVDLKVPGPGNVREAREWVARVHSDLAGGRIGGAVAEQLGEKQAIRLGMALAGAPEGEPSSIACRLDSWGQARELWLDATSGKDRVSEVPGKVAGIGRTRKDRASRTIVFCRWAEGQGIGPGTRPSSKLLAEFVASRVASGIAPATVHHDLRILVPWMRFLAERGLASPPDPAKAVALIPSEDPADPWLPDWERDLLTLRKMHESRFASPYHTAAWSCFLLCRGVGCRPTEAISLTWNSIDLEGDEILFLDTKDARLKKHRHRHRRTPILLRWVHDGLEELHRLRGERKPFRPVCVSTRGEAWSSEAMSAKAFRRIADKLLLPRQLKLKTAQKCQIRHLRWLGFPSEEIVRWSGHSRRVHDSWYDQDNATLVRPPVGRDYGGFDLLTEYGEWALDPARARRL